MVRHNTRDPQKSLFRLAVAGVSVVALLVGGVGGWAANTEIAGAVVANGTVVVESNIKQVQHARGGTVGEIAVANGDQVRKGQLLVRLDGTVARASQQIAVKTLDELAARKARLEAERDGRDTIEFPRELLHRIAMPNVAEAIAGEKRLFQSRRASRQGRKKQLTKRRNQIEASVKGLELQARAKAREVKLIKHELVGAQELWLKGLMSITRLTMLKREITRTEGEHGSLIASKASSMARIAETDLQILQIDQELMTDVAQELRQIDARRGEYEERKIAAQDLLKRIDIRAPQAGVVHQSKVHTVGGVVQAGETLMTIVPIASKLIVEARIDPKDIDQLQVNQETSLRFSAFNQRTTPEISGVVKRISADIATDPQTGSTHYQVQIGVSDQALKQLKGLTLVPGMPVEVFVKTGNRNVLSYLMKPMADQFHRAFREH